MKQLLSVIPMVDFILIKTVRRVNLLYNYF